MVYIQTVRPREFPLLGIPQGTLLKPDAVLPVRPGDVEVPAYDDFRVAEPLVPVLRLLGPAPQLEARHPRDVHQILP